MGLYNDLVMEHFLNPRNVGEIENPSGIGEVGNDSCGDIVKVYLKIKQDMIIDAKFETFGCAVAIASSSMAMELIKNKTVANAYLLTKDDIVEAFNGLPEEKIGCSLLVIDAIQKALDDYYSKEPEKYFDVQCCTNGCHCCNSRGCKRCQ